MREKAKAEKLSKGEQAKKRLVRIAARLFIKNGYHATGIRDVIEQAQTSQGSFYFYFKSKKELGVEVHKYFSGITTDVLQGFAENSTWHEFVEKLMDWGLAVAVKQKNYGCPFAVLGMESAYMEPELAALNYESLLRNVQIFKKPLLNSGLTEEEAFLKAERAFSLYEGYMLRYRLSRNLDELKKLRSALEDVHN